MAETSLKTDAPVPTRKRSWGKIVIIICAALLLLLGVTYLVVTSSAFFKGVILPKAGKAMNATISVSQASISPFKELVLKDLKVQTTGAEPLVSAPEVRLRYSLMDIMRGNMKVDEIALLNPAITLVQNADGTSNLDPLLKSTKTEPAPKETSKGAGPLKVDVRSIQIKDGSFRQIKLYSGANRDLTEVSKFNLTISDIKNGQTGKLVTSSELSVQLNPPAPATAAQLQARMNGELAFTLTDDLKPASVKGGMHLEVARAEGALAQAAGFGADLNCNLSPTEIQDLSLKFGKGATSLGQLSVRGPLSLEKAEGKLTVQLLGIDKQLFNLAVAGTGMDFGNTTLTSTNLVQLSQGGKVLSAAGRVSLNNFSVTRTNQTTPSMDLATAYSFNADTTKSIAALQEFSLTGTQKGIVLLKGELAAPMTFDWGKAGNAVGDSTLNVALNGLNLADWKPFLAQVAPAGLVNAQLKLVSKGAGNNLAFDAGSQLENLSIIAGTNQINQAGVSLSASGTVTNLQQVTFSQLKFQFTQRSQTLVTASGTGTFDSKTQAADMQLGMQATLPGLLQMLPQPAASLSSGTVEMKLRFSQQLQNQRLVGDLVLTNLVGSFGSNEFHSFAANAGIDLVITPQKIQITRLAGAISEGGKPGGGFEATGSYDLTNSASQVSAKLTGFNQSGLRPFIEPLLADKKLISLSLDGNLSAKYDPAGASDITGNLVATNLVVADKKSGTPAPPLYATVTLDAGLNKQVSTLRSVELGLTPTELGKNVLKLTGQVDASRSNAITGNLKLSADSIDLTKYYDLFGGQGASTSTTTSSTAAGSGSGGSSSAQTEPKPMTLPFTNFTAEARIGRLHLREVAITNLHAALKIDGGHIIAKPLELVLNGARMDSSVDVDLGVPGYKYSLDFNAVHVPLAPLVNSFMPDRKGQVGGTLTGVGQVAGSGITGQSLQSLTGKFDIGTTNLNLAIPSLRSSLLKTIVNGVAILPELLKNPNASLGSLGNALFGDSGSAQKGGFVDELTQSPIDVIQGRGVIGGGRMEINDVLIQSPAFQAGAHGTVKFRKAALMDEAITNAALAVPLNIALRRSLAEKVNLVPPGTPTNAFYVKLPDYVSIEGTIGQSKPVFNKVALAGTVLQQYGGKIPGLDQKTGNLLQGIGASLSGKGQNATTALSGTNQPNKSGNLLEGLGGLLGRGTASTNAAGATNAPATNQNPAGNLLNQLLGPKKK